MITVEGCGGTAPGPSGRILTDMAGKDAPQDTAPARRRRFGRKPKGGSGEGGASAAPKKQGRIAQMRAVFRMTRTADPSVIWYMLLAFLVVLTLSLAIAIAIGGGPYSIFLGLLMGLPLALMAAMFILARKAEKAAYAQLEGQPGAVGAALGSLRRGWMVEQNPVAADPRTQDLVFRAVGRPGVVLVAEGPTQRVRRLVDAEKRKVARVVPNVPVHVLHAGSDDDQVPLNKLPRRVMKLKSTLTKQEAAQVSKRLRALGGIKPPMPKGIDPMRVRADRKSMRGR